MNQTTQYHQLQPEDRMTIASMKQQGFSARAMARALGGGSKVVVRPDGQVEAPGKAASQIDQPLLVVLTRSFYWQQLLDDGVVGSGSDIAQGEGLHHSTVNELLPLTLLEPAIIQSILAGQQPRCMSLLWFQRNPLPTDWVAQRAVVAGFDA